MVTVTCISYRGEKGWENRARASAPAAGVQLTGCKVCVPGYQVLGWVRWFAFPQQPSSWSSQHPGSPSRDIYQGKDPWQISVFEGIHACRSAYKYITCLLLCINPAGKYKTHGAQERALDTASPRWMVEGLITMHGFVRLQKGVRTFTNKVQSWSAEEREGDLAVDSYVLYKFWQCSMWVLKTAHGA